MRLLFSLLVASCAVDVFADPIPEKKAKQTVIAEGDLSKWAPNALYVKAYLFDHRKGEYGDPLIKNGKFHAGIHPQHTKILTFAQVSALSKAITGTNPKKGMSLCHWPHHAFVFFDIQHKPIAHLNICFLCSTYGALPVEGLSSNWDLGAIKKLVAELKLPNFDTEKQWSEFFDESGVSETKDSEQGVAAESDRAGG
ncbi:hypothetical protein AAFN60_21410 [Roseibacillus persicicus]|uniref:hypothetical protein n=1 Tax=Roseibacillus persicicus TaxID=454148 RepID=UPI00398B129A